MTMKSVFIFLMFGAFSTKRKRTKAQNQNPNAKLRTPLLGKDNWKTVDSFLLPQNEKKFNQIHKSFSQFPPKYVNISERIKKILDFHGRIVLDFHGRIENCPNWLFFKHFETQKMFAQNVDEKNNCGETALIRATGANKIEILKAAIEAGAYIDEKDNEGDTALHFAAVGDGSHRLEVGKVLVDAGADLKRKNGCSGKTALELAETYHNEAFAEMLRKKMKN